VVNMPQGSALCLRQAGEFDVVIHTDRVLLVFTLQRNRGQTPLDRASCNDSRPVAFSPESQGRSLYHSS
jgi:hypothetical protein